MSLLEDKLSEQFYDWELRGRGWQVWDKPVCPEPPFRPFFGHHIRREGLVDDGSRPTFLSSLLSKLSERLAGRNDVPDVSEEEEEEPEPNPLERGDLVEIHASLPQTAQISKEVFEQFVLSLAKCGEPITFELLGTNEGIHTQLVAAEPDIASLRHQLEAHFPEVVCTEHRSFLEDKWNQATVDETLIFEFGLAHEFVIEFSTARNFNTDPFIGLTAALGNLREGELALFQVIFEPVRNPWDESILRSVTDTNGKGFFVNRPELADEARKKISRPLFAAVVRIAVKSPDRLLDIARDIAGALTVFSKPRGNRFIPLDNSEYNFTEHEEDLLRRQSRRNGMIVNSDELVSLVHLPSSSVRTQKLKREIDKSKAAPPIALNQNGLLLGTNSYAGTTREARLSAVQRVQHTYIIGTSGTGKSTLLFNLIMQDVQSGQGLAVFDPHGDLIDRILGSIPENRIQDVVLIDPSDEEYSVGFNILSAHSDLEKNLLASDLVSVFERLSTSWGDQMGSVLNNAILAFLESKKGGTLADLQRFLIEPGFRNEFLKSVEDPQVLYYWKKAFPQLTGNKSIGPVLTRLGSFLDRKPVRYMVTQKENRLDFAQIMDTGKIFLAKLSQGQIGNENAYLLGSFLVSKFQQLAMSRQAQVAATRRDFWLYLDEFHNFITPSMAQILNGARKYRLGLTLAHQELRQLQRDPGVASAVLSNPYTRICFRVGDDDARKLGDGFSFFESKDLQNLPNFKAVCRIERSDCDFNLAIPYSPELPEAQAKVTRERVRNSSREKYAVPRAQIEREQYKLFLDSESVSPPAREKERPPSTRVTKPEPPPSSPIAEPLPSVKSSPIEPLPVVIEPVPPPKEVPTHAAPTAPIRADLGRGGEQHGAIQKRIKAACEELGLLAAIESELPDKSGSVDVAIFENGKKKIAVEIGITTTIDHEIGNVLKCLRADFPIVAVITATEVKLRQMKEAVAAAVGVDLSKRIEFFLPDAFLAFLKSLPNEPLPPPTPVQTTRRGYKVKRSAPTLSPEEIRAKEALALRVLAETMKPKGKENA